VSRRTFVRGAGLEWIDTLVKLHNGPARLGTDCIPWPFGRDSDGYGCVEVSGRNRKATHIVLERTGRGRPEAPGNHALHWCDNPPCVHPDHLRWGTQRENMLDRWERTGR
jgi:hypothetical protein